MQFPVDSLNWEVKIKKGGMMAKEVCDYVMIKDGKFGLKIDETKTLEFDLPADVRKMCHSVLMYLCDPLQNALNLKYKVEINGKEADRGTLSSGVPRSIHEAIQKNRLKHGKNTLTFKVNSGTGKVYFSDIILFYKRSV